MNGQTFANVIEALIPVGFGIWMTLLGHRLVGKRPGEDLLYDQKLDKICPKLKIIGPVLVLIGILFAIIHLLQAP